MATVTLRISDEANAALEALAAATERSKSYVALRAIDEYIKLNAWQIAAIQAGVDDADAVRLVSHVAVKQRWLSRAESGGEG
ncbi:CopG family ribbon-helix-helix protein [Thiohalocapsa sp. ML1]|jgi:RHH-type transcriptional regulator, rel operon repressor / antitoxin RelB|uniref:CopG family ribbon-helix-helix protein n=1 Tax=Thiohalocapsa sp. ML1 TaxID=1431688 RepID=UPI0007321A41|nr:ribbon-helix-helix protein, CopG family [Thiohalocapsa sp. ML1]